jgi:hypothetical protein
LKLKKLFVVEIASVAIVLVLIMVFVEFTPYLASASQDDSIGVYNERVFTKGTVSLALGDSAGSQFNYTTYDPAILVIDLSFQTWDNSGYLSLYCNGRQIATFLASPQNPKVRLTTISVSGWDWVKPPSTNSFTYGNEVDFTSRPEGGYMGTFDYTISIRGSR